MKARDVDSAELAFKLRAFAMAMLVFGMCVAGGVIVAAYAGTSMLWGVLLGAGAGVIVYFSALFISDRSSRLAASVYGGAGSSTPSIAEYSLADSLVARGRYEEAAEAYALLSEDFPADPEPRLRHARLLRDRTGDYEAAAIVFKKILSMPALKPAVELTVLRELSELFANKLQEPVRALPFLARIAEKYATTPTGSWARAEIKDLKQNIQER